MRRTAGKRTGLAVLLAVSCAGCRGQDAKFDLHKVSADTPFVFIHRYPAYSPEPVSGLLVAVWKDGWVVRVSAEDEVGESYVEGRITPEQIASVVDMLEETELMREQDDMLIVDAGSVHVYVRLPDRIVERAESVPHKRASPIAQLRSFLLSASLRETKPITGRWQVLDLPKEWFK